MSATSYSDHNIIYADDFYNSSNAPDIIGAFNAAEASSTNATIILSPGTTYAMASGVSWSSETHSLTVVGNGATISVANSITYAIQFIQCTGTYTFENINFAGTDALTAALVALRFEGTGRYIVRDCQFTGFGIGGIGCNNFTAELLLVENCKFYALGNTRNGGADNGIGIAPTYCQNFTARDCEFYEIGTTNNDHGIYGWRGPSSGVGVWTVENCRFGADLFSNIYFREDSGEIGTATIRGCELNKQVTINCTDLVFTANHFSPAYLRVETPDTIVITGNHFTSTSSSTCIQILSLSTGGTIVGNTFYDCANAITKTGAGDLVGLVVNDNVMLLVAAAGVYIEDATDFVMTNCVFHNNTIQADAQCYYFNADTLKCSVSGTHRIGTGGVFMRLDNANTDLHVYNNAASGSIDVSTATLTDCLIESPYEIDIATPVVSLFQFAANDATPSVAVGSRFQTANNSGTTITAFDDAVAGKDFWVLINDANTTLDFTSSNLSGNNGVDYTCANGDMLRCFKGASKTHVWISEA